MKQSIVLLHGALGSSEQLEYIKSVLSDTCSTYMLDFDGHGGSPLPEAFSIDLFVQNTIDFLDQNHLQKVSIFGYSMGGYVALKLAHDYPDRVDQIVTLGTKFHWSPESAAKEVRMMNPDIIEQKIPAFAAALAERHLPSNWKEIMRRTGEMMTVMGDGDHMKESHFEAIPNQALICIGTNDHMVSIEESEHTANLLKNGRLKLIEGFKHPLEAVDQNILADICIEFFNA